jgi:polyhydroxyalkanoate synthesis regulator phasin
MGTARKDLLGRLADLSEEAIQRLSDVPGADRALGAVNALRERTDELQRRVRSLEALEQRIDALERKVEKLSKASGTSARPAARKTTSTKSSSSSTARKQS